MFYVDIISSQKLNVISTIKIKYNNKKKKNKAA